MKCVRLVSISACALLLSALAFATDKNQGNMDLSEKALVGSTQLQPGHYKLEWQPGQGNSAKVEILRHGKTIATAEAKLKDLPRPAPYDAIVTKKTDQNQERIEEVQFNKQDKALAFGS